jgi:cytochrome c556
MSLKKITAYTLAGLMTLGLAANVTAQDDPAQDPAITGKSVDELVQIRKDLMKEDGQSLKGAMTGAGDKKELAEHLLHNYTILPHAFPEDSLTEKSNALPTVWENQEGFNAIFVKGQEAANAMIAAAEAGDDAAYTTAAKELGATCNECHKDFRKVL